MRRFLRHLVVRAFRDYAAFGVAVMLAHIINLWNDVPLTFARHYVAVPLVPLIIMIGCSWFMQLCVFHQISLAYVGIMTMCIQYQEDGAGFGDLLVPMRIIMFVVGAVLLILLFVKKFRYDRKCECACPVSA